MSLFWFLLILIISILKVKFVTCGCEKSFMVICESLEDVKHNKSKHSWTELLIQNQKSTIPTSRYSLENSYFQGLWNLESLIIVQQLNDIEGDAFLASIHSVRTLILYGNDIKIIKMMTFSGFDQLVKMSLENNGIEHIEDHSFYKSNIDALDLSHNKLGIIQSDLFNECQILKLTLRNNQLTTIEPNSIPKTIKYLHLDYNRFYAFPTTQLNNLSQLVELTFSHNNILSLGGRLVGLISLKRLNLSFNKIFSISYQFDELTQLKVLDLSVNDLRTFKFPAFLTQNNFTSKQTYFFFLFHNRLRNLNLEQLRVRTQLTLAGNPWNCVCFHEMELFLRNHSRIKRIRDDEILSSSGTIPYCASLYTAKERCTGERISDEQLEVFRKRARVEHCNYLDLYYLLPHS